MKFIHAVMSLPRLVDDARAARLRVMPAVVLTGRMAEWLAPTCWPRLGGGSCDAAPPE